MADPSLMEKIVSLCKRRGFVFPASEIYGGFAGVWDYGQLGSILKRNIENLWLNRFVYSRGDMFLLDSSIIMPETVWQASGHLEGFADPMVECMKCKHRFRVDKLEDKTKCPDCGGAFGEEKMFNLLFPVSMGAAAGGATTGYLRGEIAQGMFVNFKNVLDSAHPRLPFGIAQSGKAFRNEIAPRNFLFRVREFDLMEFEYFIREKEWEEQFEYWRKEMHAWISDVGIDASAVHEIDIAPEDRAHYSKRTIDFYFDFPFGRDELYGLAYRTDYDLSRHTEKSGVDLSYLDEETGERFIPHVIEPTFGLGRTVLAVLASAYREDTMSEEMRTYLALAPKIAPVKAMVSPLLKNKPELVVKAREVRAQLQKVHPAIAWDDNGNIGKRYRRQDEIGTPFCITVDFDTLGEKPELKDTVTLRHRDSGEQERLTVPEAASRIRSAIQ
ncbi:glycine--tRNA ligase [Candidatus Kaiserbacteria bacterium RIFCSPHIGHO2_02_FULL_54_22]|uniref:glycine--tRNA ligase n=1 Tax=Candidatus Kaiserbacteria bacterium RIFCSPHIGHO2_02_FULL_54_22 TaxID=1798495 RepID=A0A1F6DLF6_9BACT|nr:MAG: glycine--tRNA ligase [Candidatus Kaiserbacteria bacterium RIFCSPHIGHO2_02_FULL_54_22]OGG68268.1 MAG: glycine--tRNA ligase [Candidatus Kaiserbacteria bacterium RIFCSPHIGHO2_12_FULL_54_16]OGG89838.1 MAG: glycine--tRNA ligase [Candidatus Kaiserbacteria bacterium RIFCSPLOWO2_12_FULL_54_10]